MKKASTLKPDVVLIDVHMHGMEGLEIEAGAVSHVLIQAGRRM